MLLIVGTIARQVANFIQNQGVSKDELRRFPGWLKNLEMIEALVNILLLEYMKYFKGVDLAEVYEGFR